MKNFADSLVRKIAEVNNPTVIGLDPKLDYIPDHIKQYAEHNLTDREWSPSNGRHGACAAGRW